MEGEGTSSNLHRRVNHVTNCISRLSDNCREGGSIEG
jgi:hypothetical protein